MPRLHRVYVVLSPLPVALLLAVDRHVSGLEGMGQWAAAPMFLAPVFLSFLAAVFGSALAVRSRRARTRAGALIAATVVAGLPALWFLYRLFLVEVLRGP